IHGAVWGLMKLLNHQNESADATPSPFAATEPREHPNPPPEPRLQPSVTHDKQPVEDMEALRQRWQRELASYARVEGDPDRARIPIKRAMELAVEGKLPKASTAPATQRAGGGR